MCVTPILAVTHPPLIYPANDIQSDGLQRLIRSYGSCSNDLFLLENEQLHSCLPMTRCPNAGARGGC